MNTNTTTLTTTYTTNTTTMIRLYAKEPKITRESEDEYFESDVSYIIIIIIISIIIIIIVIVGKEISTRKITICLCFYSCCIITIRCRTYLFIF